MLSDLVFDPQLCCAGREGAKRADNRCSEHCSQTTSGTASKAALVLETPAEQLLSACLTPELTVQVEEEECTMEKSFSATVQPPSLKKVDPDMERSETASPLTPRNAEVCMQSSQHLN